MVVDLVMWQRSSKQQVFYRNCHSPGPRGERRNTADVESHQEANEHLRSFYIMHPKDLESYLKGNEQALHQITLL